MPNETPFKDTLAVRSPLFKAFLAELLGTFLLVFIGDGGIARYVLGGDVGALSANLGFGLALMIAVYISGGVSGGHVNPAVSLSMCTLGRLRWIALPVYWAAQFFGAFIGAAVVYAIYLDGINDLEGGPENRTIATAPIFSTFPADYLTLTDNFFDQVVGTALLLAGICAVFDKDNIKPPKGVEPILVGLLLLIVGISYGYNSGGAVNPARDFGPRVFMAIAGYSGIWETAAGIQFWWIPLFAPLVGGPIGAWVYYLAVEVHHGSSSSYDEIEDGERVPLTQSQTSNGN